MLSPPPLDIRLYHVDAFVFVAHDDYDLERDTNVALDVDFDVQQNTAEPLTYRLAMRIRVADGGYTAEENSPYGIRLDIVGYFLFAPDTTEEVMTRMINLNGASILYGVARGFVGQATGAGKNGQFVLPAVNFIDLLKRRAEAEGAEQPVPAALTSGQPQESVESR